MPADAKHDLAIRPDEQEEFDELLSTLSAELAPHGALEQIAFDSLVHAAWTLHRCRRAEAELTAKGTDPLLDADTAKKQDRIARYIARAERSYYKALRELVKLQTNRALQGTQGIFEAVVPSEPTTVLANPAAVRKEKKKKDLESFEDLIRAIEVETRALGKKAYEQGLAELALRTKGNIPRA